MAGICDAPIIKYGCDAAGGAVKSVASSGFQSVVDAFTESFVKVTKTLMTFWISSPEPNVGAGSAVIVALDELTKPLVAAAAILGLVVGGVRLAWSARSDQSVQQILRGLVLMTAVTVGATVIVEGLLLGFDALGKWILDNGFNHASIGDRLGVLGAISGPAAAGASGLVFILAFFGILASLVQVGIMLTRGAILGVLVGVLPVAGASSITDVGFSWFKRLCGWIASFAVYKLVAAIIYAAAFALIGKSDDLAGIVSGMALMVVAILALPALLRLIPPSADALGGGGGGALGGLAAAGATGAVMLAGRGGGGSSSSSTPTATSPPGLKGEGGPSGSDGTSGGGSAQLPPGGGGTGSGPTPIGGGGGGGTGGSGSGGGSGAGAGAGGAAAGGGGGAAAGGAAAGSGAAAAAGPVGAGVAVAQKAKQVHSGAKSAADGAAGGGGSQ